MNIDFNDLKYNLYELLNLDLTVSSRRIKKTYKKLMLKYHPDKCSDLEKEIFYNISLAYKILYNEDSKNKYDFWLKNKNNFKDGDDLRKSFHMDINNNNFINYFPKEVDAYKNFQNESKNMIKKHGNLRLNEGRLSDSVNKINCRRKQLTILREDFKNNRKFNNSFVNRKSDNNLIKKKDLVSFSNVQLSNVYTHMNEFDNLYSNKTIMSDDFTSLDMAFLLHPNFFLKKENKLQKSPEYKKILSELENIKLSI
tara:strand:+ start:70 stop:831 length:762 start_codon:yes stop_codon:yes gene_type:complete